MFQSIPLSHAWDIGQTEAPMEARFPWVRVGSRPDGATTYAGGRIWMCFRGLQVPAGATVTSAMVQHLTMDGGARVRGHAVADADPIGGLEVLDAVLANLGTAHVDKAGLTPEQEEAVGLFWDAMGGNVGDYSDPARRAIVMGNIAWTYDYCVVQGRETQSYNAMVSAFGPWATSWPYNWAGWTPGAWDFDPPAAQTPELPDLAALIQERVDAAGWQPGNAVLLLLSPPSGADPAATVALSRDGLPTLAITWEAA